MEPNEVLKRALERERTARKSAEKILEEKSFELFLVNDELRALNQDLEEVARSRAAEIGRNERRWRYALEEAGDGMWEYNLQTDDVYFSPRFITVLGYNPKTFSQTRESWLSLVHPEDLEPIKNGFKRYLSKEIKRFEITYRIRGFDGSYRWMLDRSSLVSHSEDGRPLVIIGTNTDITERKSIENELSTTAKSLSSLIANLHAAILVENEERNIVLTNKQFCRMFGIPLEPEMLIGANCSNSAEESKRLFRNPDLFVSRIDELLRNKELSLNEELWLADGRVFERDFIPLFVNDQYKGQMWKYLDITQRKNAEIAIRESEEKYRRIIENMNLGLLEVDNEGKVIYANQSFTLMSGYAAEELLGKQTEEILTNDENAVLIREKNRLRQEGLSDAYEIQVHDKQGVVRWWMISGAPLYSDDGIKIGSIGIHLDITKQKDLERELREAKKAAEDSSRAKELFLASMSHEIRTPMNVILGLGKQLKKSPLNDLQTTFIDSINLAASNLLVIINDILDFSKIEAGKLTLEQIGFNLPELLEKSAQFLEHKAEEKGLYFTRTFDPRIASVLIGDPYRITQALMNLLSNAIKFTEKGSVALTGTLVQAAESHQTIRIQVTDTGMGMEEKFLQSIFEKFSQEDESITRKYGGSGLGMAISKQLITMMGGSIGVSSQKNIGTTFSIEITLQIGKEEDTVNKTEFVENKHLLKGRRILLVEDNQMNRLVATTILDQYAASTTEAVNGQQAIEKLQEHQIDIVLMDVQMPVMDGLESTRYIRANISKAIPVIALTANALKGEMEKCLQAGMDDFLSKPFEEADLISMIAKWLKIPLAFSGGEEPPPPKKASYSLKKLEDISRGNNDFIKKMLEMFVEDIPQAVKEIREAYDRGDLETSRSIAHRIKPTIDNMSVDSVKEEIRKIESLASAGEKNIQLDQLIEQLSEVISQVTLEIKTRELPRF